MPRMSSTTNGCAFLVHTNSGPIIGCQINGIYIFKGIPYAKPPIGSLRFGRTQPIDRWTNVLYATQYRSPCVQIVPTFDSKPSEDCLFLNIYTPSLSRNANLPVMFFIHGGGNAFGSGSQYLYSRSYSIYDGRRLSMEGVVVITINYRLGVFGFLASSRKDAPGNAGLWDQAMALYWTKANVEAFGGNPNDITVFGESAGSMSTSILAISNSTRYLFSKAIMQSGSSYGSFLIKPKNAIIRESRNFATHSLFKSGACGQEYDWIDCLRGKSWQELLSAQMTWIGRSADYKFYNIYFNTFTIIYGDEFLPISAIQALKEGNFNENINLLIGHNEMEGELFIFPFDILLGLSGRYNSYLDNALIISKKLIYNDIKNIFFKNTAYGEEVAMKYTQGFTDPLSRHEQTAIRRASVYSFSDYSLICPTILYGSGVRASHTFTGRVFQYRLTYAMSKSISYGSEWSDVTHFDDVPLVFGLPLLPGEESSWTESDRVMSFNMVKIWTYFAKYGQPPPVNGNVWPEYSVNLDNTVNVKYLELNADPNRLGRIYTNRYNGNDGFQPSIINNCTFWDHIFSDEFIT